ncbi:MAG: hypothetical protein DKM50_00630 [Candidatus Margulisiibacteriota bacterium]|nr:MAG: hypothetical protein A2X43_05470 [Candidatus Margulisbacteria bacterium GWD2_39_127]OGI04362.1 MAG: hypothetical protein A2X42_07150 [Candidatus Margulisbacteria bacterium GWF2_38_17]OGI07782.1 MAG: hypothetical protein A2X41_07820 [Candidatus Margulisbacteria bacterium GWE2_39_32]PZM84831.1 MAG: hypothetical protein DKM50_00630 [Candidatus Margulisiibacteriota bacterium]HAR63296.1 hypothetical protein [Candidatus Margulisiibacteriota bacterium]
MRLEQITNNFSKKASNYNSKAVMQKEIAEKLALFLPDKEYKTILDVGCGTGFLTKLLRQKYPNSTIIGVDIAPAMIEIAKENVPDAEFRCCSIYEIEDLKNQFDLVVSSSALHWMHDLSECFAILHDILVPNGEIITAIFVDESLFELKDSFNYAYENTRIKKKKHVIDFPKSQEVIEDLSKKFELLFNEKIAYFLNYSSAKNSIKAIREIGGNYSYLYNQSFTERKTIFSTVFTYYDKKYRGTADTVIQSWEILMLGAKRNG